jgi:hypothetical protein
VETAERPSTNEHQQLQQAKRLQELEQEPEQESQGTHRVSERRHVEYLHTRKAPNRAQGTHYTVGIPFLHTPTMQDIAFGGGGAANESPVKMAHAELKKTLQKELHRGRL